MSESKSISPRIGLLPLYLQLYETALPALRGQVTPHLNRLATLLRAEGLAVDVAPICRVASEVGAAVQSFETSAVDAIATLHLAYSPSLEAIDALTKTDLPLILIDTSPDADFSQDVDPLRLLENHGVHGVQDLASMLVRRARPFFIVAGHLEDPTLAARTADLARAALAARRMHGMRVLRIGPLFPGMGDFRVDESEFRERFGIEVTQETPADLIADIEAISPGELATELAADAVAYAIDAPAEVHRYSARLGLGLSRRLARGGFGAFSMNFQAFDSDAEPIVTVPFLECCKAMARGTGYAGEGDVLTAALTGALLAAFPESTFTEIFCADWQGDSIFLSHMGEINPRVAAPGAARLVEKEYGFSAAKNPAMIAAAPRPGPATWINLAPVGEKGFRLIAAPVEVLEDGRHLDYRNWVRGWLRAQVPVVRFLEEFSRLGGTHHSVLVLGNRMEAMEAFAKILDLEFHAIQ